MEPNLQRLQKVIAASGHYSRREAEDLITRGLVSVNGKRVTEMGVKCDPLRDAVKVQGRLVASQVKPEYVLFHKPKKCLVTRDDPEGRKTIYDFLPRKYHHLKSVGRLDYDSEGLLLLTNDGELMNKLTHPRAHVAKEYEVKVSPIPTEAKLARLKKGMILDGRKTLPLEASFIEVGDQSAWIKMVLQEGRNRQIRRMCEMVGLTVKKLIRTRVGPFELKGIKRGELRVVPISKVIV